MKKKKYKIIVILFLIVSVFSLSLVDTKAEDSEENTTCTKTVNFYFLEAITKGLAQGSSSYTTSFQAPDGWNDVKVKENKGSRTWGVSDLETYVNVITNNAGGVGGVVACDESQENCVNSGTGMDYAISDFSSSGIGGYSFSEFFNKFITPSITSSVTISSSGQTISATVSRSYTVPSETDDYYNSNRRFVPVVATFEFEYTPDDGSSCDSEVPDDVECPSTSVGTNISGALTCSTTKKEYTGEVKETLEDTHTVQATNQNICQTEVEEEVTAETLFYQKGTLSIIRPDNQKYAGGGFYFDIDYKSSAYWKYCDNSNNAKCYRKEYIPVCNNPPEGSSTSGSTSIAGSRVSYEINKEYETEGTVVGNGCKYYYNTTKTYYLGGIGDEETSPSDVCSSLGGYLSGARCIVDGGSGSTMTGEPDCNSEHIEYNECVNQEEANKLIKEQATSKYQGLTDNAITVQSYNSNNVGNNYENIGRNSTTSDSKPGQWEPNEMLDGRVDFSLLRACINVYTAEVTYTNSSCPTETIDGGIKYYIPLKYSHGSSFPIKAVGSSISLLTNMDWSFDYNCGVTCDQKLYNIPGDSSFKFIYRPVELSDAFPNRQVGSNWRNFKLNTSAYNDKMTRNKKEYEITLTLDNINALNNNNSFYSNLRTIYVNGKSSIPIVGSSRQGNNTINELGKCTEECW